MDTIAIVSLLNSGIHDEREAGYRDEFRRGRGIGIQRGVEATVKAMGYEVDWEEDDEGNPVAVGIRGPVR